MTQGIEQLTYETAATRRAEPRWVARRLLAGGLEFLLTFVVFVAMAASRTWVIEDLIVPIGAGGLLLLETLPKNLGRLTARLRVIYIENAKPSHRILRAILLRPVLVWIAFSPAFDHLPTFTVMGSFYGILLFYVADAIVFMFTRLRLADHLTGAREVVDHGA